MTNVVVYDANKFTVNAVTVFQTNRAEVKRKIEITLKDGQNEVEVRNLPTCLDQDSIRVDGIGKAVIFDVIYRNVFQLHPKIDSNVTANLDPPPPWNASKQVEALGDHHKRQASLSAELDILKRQSEVLKEYSKTLTAKDTTSEQLEAFLDVYAARQHSIDDACAKLEAQIQQVKADIANANLSINADEETIRERGTKVTIVVLGDGDGDAELCLTYVVSKAWWTPQYDLRASIAHDPKSESTVNLHYRASISQSTGENWANVNLVLSTASPLQGTRIPTLEQYCIGEYVDPQPVYKKRARQAKTLSLALRDAPAMSMTRALVSTDAESEAFGSPPGFFAGRDSVATEGAISATFAIPGLSSIPSDSPQSSQTHKVSIAEIELSSVALEWITVPKDIPSAFLQCKVKNTSQYVLLPGQTNVFMNNSFVAKSTIPHVSPQESFSCSLGIDPAVRVTYHPQIKKAKTSSSFISTKSTNTVFEQRFTVKNTRLTSIRRLIAKDQVPVSSDARIKVNVLEPKDLQIRTTKSTRVQNGVVAQWVPRNEELTTGIEDTRNVSNDGFIEWICEIDPGASVDVTLVWEVIVPTGLVWAKQ